MQPYFITDNLIDLISDKHAKLRKMVIDEWIKNENEEITDTESYIIAIIGKERSTVAQIGKKIGISRQGAHKSVKGLMAKGYIKLEDPDSTSREKFLALTEKGIYFLKETLIIKQSLEKEIIKSIGEEKFYMIKEIFSNSWF